MYIRCKYEKFCKNKCNECKSCETPMFVIDTDCEFCRLCKNTGVCQSITHA